MSNFNENERTDVIPTTPDFDEEVIDYENLMKIEASEMCPDLEVLDEAPEEFEMRKAYETDASSIETVTTECTYMPQITNIPEASDSHKKTKTSFKKKVAAACLVAIFAGSSLGAGIGAGISATNSIIASNVINMVEVGVPQFSFGDSSDSLNATWISSTNSTTVAEVVKKVSSSVVSIITHTESTSFSPFGRGSSQQQQGAGSGVIFAQDNEKIYVVTNNHVIDGAISVTISIDDKVQIPANYVGTDATQDIAVISVLKTELVKQGISNVTLATLGNSDKMEVGDSVVAIGNALGNGQIATLGIISAVDKTIEIDGRDMYFMQTDAAINPGNSGGALVNQNAEVIGINTAKISASSYGVEGIGFCIPSNKVKEIVEEIMNTGSVTRPYLGIMGISVTEQMKEMYSFPSLGVIIDSVTVGSGAQKAGLTAYDIIVGYNDIPISTMEDLTTAIANTKVGDKVKLSIYRNGKTPLTLEVEIKDANAPKF